MVSGAEQLNPLKQFKVYSLFSDHVGTFTFTNASMWMVIAVVFVTIFMIMGMRKRRRIPGYWQLMAEGCYSLVADMVRSNVGEGGRKYFPFIFTLFMFVLVGNLLGLLPFGYSFTSQLIVTFALASFIFITTTVIGILRHGFRYTRLFFPEGAPLWTAFILVPIELVSYLSRPISLSVRLFANMTVGHVMLYVLGSFVVSLGIAGFLPVLGLVAIIALEILVAVIQAYVFTILSCVYLHDALHLH